MLVRAAATALFALLAAPAGAQDNVAQGNAPQSHGVTLKAAIVALTSNSNLRASFERELVALARANDYDAMTSYDIMSDVHELDNDEFLQALKSRGVQAVLMVRPAAVGPHASLDSVRNAVSPRLFANMQRFARQVSKAGPDDLIAVVHLGIYVITGAEPVLISSGAVWLDEPVGDRAEGIKRLEGLILKNVDAVRPAIRQHLGLPRLPQKADTDRAPAGPVHRVG